MGRPAIAFNGEEAAAMSTDERRTRGIVRRVLIAAALLLTVAAVAIATCTPLGGRATGARLERMKRSPEWQGSHFENPQPIVNDIWAAIVHQATPSPNAVPQSLPSIVRVEPGRFAAPPPSGLRVTWLG